MEWRTNLISLSTDTPPPFHNTNLSVFREWKKSFFFIKEKEQIMHNQSVDLSKVIGHDQGYPTMTWAHMLKNLKRIDRALEFLEQNPEYYLQNFSDSVSFCEVDGALFISSGKHRVTIARYLAHYNPEKFPDGPILKGATVIQYSLNHELMNQFQKLRSTINQHKHLQLNYYPQSFESAGQFQIINTLRPYESTLFFSEVDIPKVYDLFNTPWHSLSYWQDVHVRYLRKTLLNRYW